MSSTFTIEGTVHALTPTVEVGNGYRKRDLVVRYVDNPEYPQLVKLEANQKVTDKLDGVKPGDTVRVHFNIRGREWVNQKGETVYFTSLSIWKVDVAPGQNANQPTFYQKVDDALDDSDLPF